MFFIEKKYINYKSGVTLVEMIVVLGIISVIMGVTLYNYSDFKDKASLSSESQELVSTIREVQTYSISVKEVGVGSGHFDYPYGLYFNPSCNPGEYYIFADKNGNEVFDIGGGCGDPASSAEFIQKIMFKNNITVSALCDVSDYCFPPDPVVKKMNIMFFRPDLDAKIKFRKNDSSLYGGLQSQGKIKLMSPKGFSVNVVVQNTGLIFIQ